MHVGSGSTPPKTEAMYFPPPRTEYTAANTSPVIIYNTAGVQIGFVGFTQEFKYLGSIIDSSLTSDADINNRIKAATAAFGALKNVLCSLSVESRIKGNKVYTALVLSILLYGSEAWCLREDRFNKFTYLEQSLFVLCVG